MIQHWPFLHHVTIEFLHCMKKDMRGAGYDPRINPPQLQNVFLPFQWNQNLQSWNSLTWPEPPMLQQLTKQNALKVTEWNQVQQGHNPHEYVQHFCSARGKVIQCVVFSIDFWLFSSCNVPAEGMDVLQPKKSGNNTSQTGVFVRHACSHQKVPRCRYPKLHSLDKFNALISEYWVLDSVKSLTSRRLEWGRHLTRLQNETDSIVCRVHNGTSRGTDWNSCGRVEWTSWPADKKSRLQAKSSTFVAFCVYFSFVILGSAQVSTGVSFRFPCPPMTD